MNTNRKTINEIKQLTGAKLTLGSYLAAIRQGEEWSQTELAGKLGVSRQFICDIEHGRRILSLKMAEDIARKLEYSPKQFVRLCLQEMVEKQGLHYEVDIVESKVA